MQQETIIDRYRTFRPQGPLSTVHKQELISSPSLLYIPHSNEPLRYQERPPFKTASSLVIRIALHSYIHCLIDLLCMHICSVQYTCNLIPPTSVGNSARHSAALYVGCGDSAHPSHESGGYDHLLVTWVSCRCYTAPRSCHNWQLTIISTQLVATISHGNPPTCQCLVDMCPFVFGLAIYFVGQWTSPVMGPAVSVHRVTCKGWHLEELRELHPLSPKT